MLMLGDNATEGVFVAPPRLRFRAFGHGRMAHGMYSEIRSLIRYARSISFALALAGQDPRVLHHDWIKNGGAGQERRKVLCRPGGHLLFGLPLVKVYAMNRSYEKALDKALSELGELLRRRREIDEQVSQVRDVILALYRKADDNKTRKEKLMHFFG